MSRLAERELVVGVTPFEEPNAFLVVALARAGVWSVLDLGRDAAGARAALVEVCRWWSGDFGVRVAVGCPLICPSRSVWWCTGGIRNGRVCLGGRSVVEVVSLTQARAAVRAGADGLIAKGLRTAAGWAPRRRSCCSSSCWPIRRSTFRCGLSAGSDLTARLGARDLGALPIGQNGALALAWHSDM
jgi:hypothetical protein